MTALNHRIEIQEPVTVTDSFGERIPNWLTVFRAWASLEPVAGRKYFADQGLHSDTTHAINTPYFSGVTTKMRVKYGERTFVILQASNVGERNRQLFIQAKERTS